MSSLNGRKVMRIQLHDVPHISGLGQLTTTLDSQSRGQLRMETIDGGVFVRATGGVEQGSPAIEFIIPYAMCKVVQLVPEGK